VFLRNNVPRKHSLYPQAFTIAAKNISRDDERVFELREDDLGAIYAEIVIGFGGWATDVCSR
jgi:hypothetical protein